MFWYGVIAGLFGGFGLSRIMRGQPTQDDMVTKVEQAFPGAMERMAEELRDSQVSGTEGYGFEVKGEKIQPYARKVPLALQALALYYCMLDPETPLSVKIGIAAALGYLVSPVDLVPDTLPGIGWLDDAGAILAAVQIAWGSVKPEHLERAKAWLEGQGVLIKEGELTALLKSLVPFAMGKTTGREMVSRPRVIDVDSGGE